MLSMTRGMLVLLTTGAVALPLAAQMRSSGSRAPAPAVSHGYSKAQVEFYLSAEEKEYVRPGLNTQIVDFEIPADRRPVVELTFTDDLGLPLDRAGRYTPGAISASFVLASYDPATRQYTAYTTRPQTSPITGVTEVQASSDSGGSWTDLEIGRARYRFGTALPAGYEMSRTHTLYFYSTRATADILGKDFESDLAWDFRPDGMPVTETWNAVDTATCNSCHDPLALHGGHRREVKGCATCHSAQSVDPDTGNTVDLKVMIHKIHYGADLPSVQAGTPYQIIGFRQSVHDYSEVLMPQDIRNCDTCHTGGNAKADGFLWYAEPSRKACGSCHDDIDWETGEGHNNIAQETDNLCSRCHVPQGDREFDASIMGAHTIPTKSTQLAGLNMEITEVTNVGPGDTPTVYFRLTNDDGSMVDDIAGLRTLTLRAAGPTGNTIDYTTDLSVDARDATTAGDAYMKTFSTPLPANATGTWGFSADVRRTAVIDDGSDDGLEVTEGAFNPVYYAQVTDAKAVVPRREVVDMAKCNTCHDVLSLHGGQRFNVQECVFCHRPNNDDSSRRPAAAAPPESVDMRWMIHSIHTGHELERDYTVYGFGGTPHNYNHVGYPGDRRNCEGCHEEDTYGVPLPEGTADVPTLRDWYSPKKPAAAACLGCHSSLDAAAHAFVNTAPFGESCAACHGAEREYSVDKVHAR